jgi:hypothetical protein
LYEKRSPILILSTLCKVLVKVMYNSLSQHRHYKNTLIPEEFGLREATSTDDVTHKLAVSVLKSIKQK